MQLPQFLLLAGALGVTALPSHHAHVHAHRSAHAQRDASEPEFYMNVHPIPSSSVAAAPSASPAPAPAPPPPPPPAPPAASSAPSSGQYIPFCSERNGGASSKAKRDNGPQAVNGSSKAKRVTLAQVNYVGNTGMSNGCPWASNLMLVPNDIAHLYHNVQQYTNVANEHYQCICGLKAGPAGGVNGMFRDTPGTESRLTFMIAPGETKTVVAEDNTQGVCALAPGSVPTTPDGQWAGNWVEFDMASAVNNGYSGGDVSALVAQHYNMPVPNLKLCQGGICSSVINGKGDNGYTSGMEAVDGTGLNLSPGPVNFKITVGLDS